MLRPPHSSARLAGTTPPPSAPQVRVHGHRAYMHLHEHVAPPPQREGLCLSHSSIPTSGTALALESAQETLGDWMPGQRGLTDEPVGPEGLLDGWTMSRETEEMLGYLGGVGVPFGKMGQRVH